MKVHKEPRCLHCDYQRGGRGNDFLCDLLRTEDNEPAMVVTETTTFEKFENCAYRHWARVLEGQTLVEMARKAREGEEVPTDYPRYMVAA